MVDQLFEGLCFDLKGPIQVWMIVGSVSLLHGQTWKRWLNQIMSGPDFFLLIITRKFAMAQDPIDTAYESSMEMLCSTDWTEVSNDGGVLLEGKSYPNSPIHAFRATALLGIPEIQSNGTQIVIRL